MRPLTGVVLYIVVAIVWAYVAVRITKEPTIAIFALAWPIFTPIFLLMAFGEWVASK